MTLLQTRHDKVHFIPLDQIHRMQGLLNMDLVKYTLLEQINRLIGYALLEQQMNILHEDMLKPTRME